MKLQDRIIAFSELGKQLFTWIETKEKKEPSVLDEVVESAFYKNGWFDESQVMYALKEVASWLNEKDIHDWANPYDFDGKTSRKRIGVIMAGNIPLVGYHDYLSVLISGNKLLGKLSSKDEVLIRFLHEQLISIQPKFQDSADFSTERFNEIDAVIATGSNNSSRYFDYYFSKIPNIIRKNRTSVAILTGKESKDELASLGNDIFRYYGLGCRNITKVYFPKGFDINWFYEGILAHSEIINNHKYQNNYDYHKSLYLLNRDKLWDNNFLLLKKDKSLSSPVGTLFYEEYEDVESLQNELAAQEEQIQCKVGVGGYGLGQAQKPRLTDYSDNINVLEFLLGLE